VKYATFASLFILFIFQGCSLKHVSFLEQKATVTDKKECLICEDDTSEFDDEFGEEDQDIFDPLSGYNRLATSFNDTLFIHVLDPLSEGYAYILPKGVRDSLTMALHNIQFPIRFTNNILQGKFRNASDELERFIVNSTVGVAGLFDPAKEYMHISEHNEDFGQTLGYYGVGTGFHIVIPVLGPSNLRDIVGLTTDGYLSPLLYQKGLKHYKIPQNYAQALGIYTLDAVNKNALHPGAYESLKKDAIDLYPFLRDVYEQKRNANIKQ